MQNIPFNSDPWRAFTTTLNGVAYRFETNFNERNQVWSFDLHLESTGEMLVAGVPLLIGADVLAPYALGIGSIYVVDTTAVTAREVEGTLPQWVDAGPEDLGTRVLVSYVAPGEVWP